MWIRGIEKRIIRKSLQTRLSLTPSYRAFSRSVSDSSPDSLDRPTLELNETCDVLIVGSGAAGLVAALRAHHHGLKPVIIEKSTKIGGASAYSGGGVWVPNNHISKSSGTPDSIPNALKYMETIVGDVGPVSSRARKMAFLTQGPEMIAFLSKLGFEWKAGKGYPDYYPDKDGGSLSRSIEGKAFNMKRLGDWQQYLLVNPGQPNVAIYTYEARHLSMFLRSWKSAWIVINALILRTLGRTILGQKPVTLGKSLVSQLMLLNKNRGIGIFRDSPLVRLLVENDKVVGAVVNHKGRDTRLLAKRGVLLCAGGFAKNQQMREKYGKEPASVKWTLVPPNDTGDAVRAGQQVGAALSLMDDAWWGPTLVNPVTNKPTFMIYERSLPHGIIVDSHGRRFMNEAQSYTDCGHAQYERNATVPAIPAWLIVDSRHRNRYMMATMPPGMTPKWVLESGWLKKADNLKELAKTIGVDGDGLQSTVERFNEMAARGIDDDFGRGRTAYDQYFGDQTCKPNPNLGSIEKPPFFAIQVWPGDLGTKGGLLTDEHARVVNENGKPILGLYAAGNTSASVMGRTYAGPGSTLGPACSFAFIAMDHLAQEKQDI